MASFSSPEPPASLVAELRRFARDRAPRSARTQVGGSDAAERCDFCSTGIAAQHNHMLDIQERRILCACETCLVRQSGEGRYRPTGKRLVELEGFQLSDETWGRFAIPVGLAFFFHSGSAGHVIALYPSPIGATESALELATWQALEDANPVLRGLEPDAEALIVGRTLNPAQYFIAPIDECYRLVGLIKSRWEGISGGSGAEAAIAEFFTTLRARAAA